jgi:hypothetical protein
MNLQPFFVITRTVASFYLLARLVFAVEDYAAAQRFEIVAPTPKGTVVFDKATGEAFVRPPLPFFQRSE